MMSQQQHGLFLFQAEDVRHTDSGQTSRPIVHKTDQFVATTFPARLTAVSSYDGREIKFS